MSEIISIIEIVPNVHELVLHSPEVAKKAQPGQFAVVIPDEVGERIPISLADWDEKRGTVTLYFLEVGVSTMKLARKRAGENVDFMAPLGKPSTIKKFGTVFVGGGCYGIGGIKPIVKALKEAGNKVITAIEARSEYLIYHKEEREKYSDEIFLSTSDATAGTKGKVKNIFEILVERGEKIDAAYFMGCTFMMMMSSREAANKGVKSFVYLNPLMVDATGMCGVCRVTVNGETKFACVDGPEFSGGKVDWEELFRRKSQYSLYERDSYEHHCRLERGIK